jgi:serine/threonine protein kinase
LIETDILIDNKGRVVLIDFGYATIIKADELLRDFCGTPLYGSGAPSFFFFDGTLLTHHSYAAPELLRHEPYCGLKTDIWALGCILYEITVGKHPFLVRAFSWRNTAKLSSLRERYQESAVFFFPPVRAAN